MATVRVDTSSLLNWARYMSEVAPRKTKAAISRSLNSMSDNLLVSVSRRLAADTGLNESRVRELIIVRPSTPDNLRVQLDLSEVQRAADDRLAPDPFQTDTGAFSQDELVNVKTAGDDDVCMQCQEIAEKGPYPYAEARSLIPHHPNCRCQLVAFQTSRRRASMRIGTGSYENATVGQIGRMVAGEMKVILKAV